MRTLTMLCCFLAIVFKAEAKNYYFSTTDGNDSRTSTEAQNPATPWKTISKLNSFFKSIKEGDNIYFKRGNVFLGSLEIDVSGKNNQPITIGAYGTGPKPVLNGMETLNNWKSVGNGKFETTVTWFQDINNRNTKKVKEKSLNLVLFNNVVQPVGRFPKANLGTQSYFTINAHDKNKSITSNEIGSIPNFVGGELVQRTMQWIFDRSIVKMQTSTTIDTEPLVSPDHKASTYSSMDGHGFFFQNHINTLTTLGDWCFNESTGKITMFFGANSPTNYNVSVSTVSDIIAIDDQEYINIQDLELRGANENLIHIDASRYCKINNVDFYFSGINGIDVDRFFFFNTYDNQITNCNFNNINNNALNLVESFNWVITNNVITNVGLIAGSGKSGDGQYVAIFKPGSNTLIEYNKLDNIGYSGIWFNGNNTIVRHNEVSNFCKVKSDGGGIYTYGITGANRVISKNIVYNGIGDRFGLKTDLTNPYADQVHGIYMDGYASNVTITENTAFNNSHSGLWLGSNANITATGNILYNNTVAQIKGIDNEVKFSNLNLTNNILFATVPEQLILSLATRYNYFKSLGTINNNFYCRPKSENTNISTPGYPNSPKLTNYPGGGIIEAHDHQFYSLDTWKLLSGVDSDTKKTPTQIPSGSKVIFEYNASKNNKTISLDGTYRDVKNIAYNGSVTLAPYTSIILLKDLVNGKSDQTINFPAIASKTFGDVPFTVNATATSGLSVSYKIISGPATVSGNTITLTNTGTVVIEASQSGSTTFNAAPSVTITFTVNPVITKINQTINFSNLPDKTFGDAPYTPLSAFATSGLPIDFKVLSGPAVLIGHTISLTGVGTVTIQASQPGNNQYNAAPSVNKSFMVAPAIIPVVPVQPVQNTTACSATGSILREQWNNIFGINISNIPLNITPASTRQLTALETVNTGENMGARISGFICAPLTGKYTFYIAGDDEVELWLSTNDQPANKSKIAGFNGWTGYREWNKYSTQKSASITLTKGQKYFIEVLHKNGGGGDHVSVKWDMPDGTTEVPLQGKHLSPNSNNNGKLNQTITFGTLPNKTFGDAPYTPLSAQTTSGLPVTFTIISGPAVLNDHTITLTGHGTVTIEATQPGNNQYNAAPAVIRTFTVAQSITQNCSASGSILREQWDNIFGINVRDIPLNKTPNSTHQISVLETQNTGGNMGARISGYICPPITGKYTFYIAGDDEVELYLSTDDKPSNKVKIAGFDGWTGFRDYDKYSSQKSKSITLTTGQRYYIEVLQKNGGGGDHVSVKWDLPNGITESPIPGSRLSPFSQQIVQYRTSISSESKQSTQTTENTTKESGFITAGKISTYPNPFQSAATVKFYPLESGETTLSLFDLQGRQIRILFRGVMEYGMPKTITLSSDGLTNGFYILRMISKGSTLSQKITISR